MDFQLSIQNDLDGLVTIALNEFFNQSKYNESITRIYSSRSNSSLSVGEDIKAFSLNVIAGVVGAFIYSAIINISTSPSSSGKILIIEGNDSSNTKQCLLIDLDNVPDKESFIKSYDQTFGKIE